MRESCVDHSEFVFRQTPVGFVDWGDEVRGGINAYSVVGNGPFPFRIDRAFIARWTGNIALTAVDYSECAQLIAWFWTNRKCFRIPVGRDRKSVPEFGNVLSPWFYHLNYGAARSSILDVIVNATKRPPLIVVRPSELFATVVLTILSIP